MKDFRVLLFVAVLTIVFGCKRSEILEEINQEKVEVRLTFSSLPLGVIATRLDPSEESVINDINIIAIDNASGGVISQSYVSSYSGGEVTVDARVGLCRFMAVANLGFELPVMTNEAELKGYEIEGNGILSGHIMEGYSSVVDVSFVGYGGMSGSEKIVLHRAYCKATVAFDFSQLDHGVEVVPKWAVVRQVSSGTNLFGSYSAQSTDHITDYGAKINDPYSTNHSTSTPLYFYENLQGQNTTDGTQQGKSPQSGKESMATYLEVYADLSQSDGSRDMIYRYYLGANSLDDFDIERNTWYKVTMVLAGSGGSDEVSWRVEKGDLIANSEKYNIPYHSGRTTYFYRPNTFDSEPGMAYTSENSFSGTVTTIRSNITPGSKHIGAFVNSTNGKSNEVYILSSSQWAIIPDMSIIHLPAGATAGWNDFHPTVTLNFLEPDKMPQNWSVAVGDNSSWLYFGDGETYASFFPNGGRGHSGTSGMYGNQSKKVDGSNFKSGTIAVRASRNNNNGRARYGRLTFYDENSNIMAEVLVKQNGSNGNKKLPIYLDYTSSGVYKPGSYGSDGLSSSTPLEGASTKDLYYDIEGFYFSPKECTVQQYCDFLNDIGVRSIDELKGNHSRLGKSGNMSLDYPGVNGTDVGEPFIMGECIENSTGRWNPVKRYIVLENGDISSEPISIGNYPMHSISYYAMVDYHYWLFRLWNSGYNRSSGGLGFTEGEWEFLARSINNGYGSIAEFDACSSPTRNGYFPYVGEPIYGLEGTDNDNNNTDLWTYSWINSGGIDSWSRGYGALIVDNTPSGAHIVGTLKPSSIYYTYDINGNVEEWVLDNYNGEDNLPFSKNTLHNNPLYIGADSPTDIRRVVRGGSVDSGGSGATNANRRGVDPCDLSSSRGFRAMVRP